ncbi:MAG: TonB-dependent receptor plug domain-containing protein [Bacteroidota bacterium]|nr:TonB-dependent receptor plug domain-containing protein [Bacteroidota bacterium]
MKYRLFLVFLILSGGLVAQRTTVEGIVKNKTGEVLPVANLSTPDGKYFTETDENGYFNIKLPGSYKLLAVMRLGYIKQVINLDSVKTQELLQVVMTSNSEIGVVTIRGDKLNAGGTVAIDPGIASVIPSVNESVESIIKTQIGVVGSRSEMSSQYSVRGGNYDENLVYVNGIEVYRPKLIRSGQQEGLSFVNPLMVSSVGFSAGAFKAEYGDKMSSVLDVRYKKPREFKASVSGGLLGGSGFVQGTAWKKKISHISSLRYKSNKYLLNSLETEGDYKPTFIDFQSYVNYRINRQWDLSLLMNVSDNKYLFVPESKVTTFGTISEAYGIFVDFDGKEIDRFTTLSSALNLDWHPTKYVNFSLAVSATEADEQENYDIIGAYSLNQLDSDMSSGNVGDSILNLGLGKFIRHARNRMQSQVYSVLHKGSAQFNNHYFKWGADMRIHKVYNKTDEWEMLDSAGYSVPNNSQELILSKNYQYEKDFLNYEFSSFVQDKFEFQLGQSDVDLIAGLRLTYNTFSDELLFSPRVSMAYQPNFAKAHVFRIAGGYYYQPPFYKAVHTFNGDLVGDSKSQRSVHLLFADEYRFFALGRNLVLNAEIYYKQLTGIIPFEVNNVRIQYYADQRSDGYVAGIDAKISGEFVPGVDSWFSLSVMKTEERLYSAGAPDGFETGYIPRPTDQRVSVALFLQDYIPGNKRFKAHLSLLYGTPFAYGPPESGRVGDTLRSPDYKRVDLGASAVLLRSNRFSKISVLKHVESIWFTVEVFNLLDVENTISYTWLRVVPNTAVPYNGTFAQYAVANHLTSRRLNLKLQIRF